jgi:outer membrane protein assembly factor BamB
MIKKVFFFLAILLTLNCRKSDDYIDSYGVHHSGNPVVKWRFVFPDTLTFPGDIKPIVYKDKVFFTFGNIVYAFNKQSGAVLGKWKEESGWYVGIVNPIVWKNLIIFNASATKLEKIVALNMDTYKKEWEIPIYSDADEVVVMNNKIFLIRNSGLAVLNLSTLKEEKSIPLKRQTGIFEMNTFPQFYFNLNKEICFVTVHYKDEERHLLNYNVNLDTVIYDAYLYNNKGYENISNYCRIYNDKVIFNEGTKKMKGCSLKTGEILWLYELNVYGGTTGTYPTFGDSSVIVGMGSNSFLTKVNVNNGRQIWKVEKQNKLFGFSSNENLYCYKDVVYWNGGGDLFAFKSDNAKAVWQNWAKKRDFSFPNYMVFDDGNIYLGATNSNGKGGHSAVCIEAIE